MACINKNLKEFQDLALSFPSENQAYALAMMWQSQNNSDAIPTYKQVKEMRRSMKKEAANKKDSLQKTIVDNLISMDLVEQVNDQVFVKLTKSDYLNSSQALQNKSSIIKNILVFNDVPADFITVDTNNPSAAVTFNNKIISDNNPVLDRKKAKLDKTRKILDYILPKVPGLDYQFVSLSDAKIIYDAIPDELKENVDFNQVKSFFNPVNNQVVLIDSRVTDEIAVEEVLHPLVAALKIENKELFDNLFEEAKESYPELFKKIDRLYEKDIEEELVTQALSKHFKKEYENKPTGKFLNAIKKFLQFFKNAISNMASSIRGITLPISTIDANTTLTEIAKKLNTPDLLLQFDIPKQMKVKYALSEDKQKVVDNALEVGSEAQKRVVLSLFKNVMEVDEEYDQFAASITEKGPFDERTLVVLDEETHTYTNVFNKSEEYVSSTSTFNKKFSSNEFDFNKYMGNIFDTVLENLILGNSIEQTLQKLNSNKQTPLNLLSESVEKQEEEIKKIYENFNIFLSGVKNAGDILIPQVIIHNKAQDTENYKNIAGAIDLLLITPEGQLKVIDLKTSVHSINSPSYTKMWPIDGTLLNESSKKLGNEISTFSKQQKHALQLALYSSILENMGYEITPHDPYFTINVRIAAEGKGVDQKYLNEFEFEGKNAQKIEGEIQDFELSKFPLKISEIAASYLVEDLKYVEPTQEYLENPSRPDTQEFTEEELNTETNAIKKNLEAYENILLKRREAIQQLTNQIFVKGKPLDNIKKIDKTLGMISLALGSTNQQQINQSYVEVLLDAIKQSDNFIDYLQNPSNFDDSNFLKYVKNAKEFAMQFYNLKTVKDGDFVNPRISKLILRLQGKLNELTENDSVRLSLTDQAMFDFVRDKIYGTTSQDLTLEEIDSMMREGLDISGLEYWTGDMDTSEDIFLRVMKKMFKQRKRKLAETVNLRAEGIVAMGQKLEFYSEEKDPEKFYDFMINEDGTLVEQESVEFINKVRELKSKLYDSETGDIKKYIEIDDPRNFTPEQIQYNIDLANAKREYSEFLAGEKIENGTYTSGLNFEYTEEYKNARDKVAYFKNRGGEVWDKKIGISQREYENFRNKYMNKISYMTVWYEKGAPTAKTKMNTKWVVKNEYKKLKTVDSNGKLLTNEKYRDIMNPTTKLGEVQKEYYLYYKETLNLLLDKLPPGERASMYGRIPVVRNKFAKAYSSKPLGVQTLWYKLKDTLRSIVEFFTNTSYLRAVTTNEFGEVIDAVPIRFTGRLRDDEKLKEIDNELQQLNEKFKNGDITLEELKKQRAVLKGQREVIDARPASNEVSRDLTSTLLQFSLMAENYETMSEAEDIYHTFLSVIENRQFRPAGNFKYGLFKGKEFQEKSTISGKDSNVYKRAQAFMNMNIYQKDKIPKNAFDKLVNGIIKFTSFSYVSLNPFGSYNNYLFGKLSNYNEAFGQRFFSRKSYTWAENEFKRQGIESFIERTSSFFKPDVNYEDVLDSDMAKSKSAYDAKYAMSKFEAMVSFYGMMDKASDIREMGSDFESKKDWKSWAINASFKLQDWGEYVNQTKIGMAIMKDIIVQDKDGKMPEISLYDAYVFEPSKASNKLTNGLKLKEGYEDLIILKAPGQFKLNEATDQSKVYLDDVMRINIRTYIREVNKQVHGNYAEEDRMVLQQYSWGKLLAQFHKWVVPAVNARFQREYYDENLGWMEGRYKSAIKLIWFGMKNLNKVSLDKDKMIKEYMEYQNLDKSKYTELQWDELMKKNNNRIMGAWRTIAETGLIFSIMAVSGLLNMLLDDDDEDEEYKDLALKEYSDNSGKTFKRSANWARWQSDRLVQDFTMMSPLIVFSADSYKQLLKMVDSPFASTRTLGELGEALSYSISTPLMYALSSEEEFMANSEYVYQRGNRKGQLKLTKNWGDALPIWYSINKWISFDNLQNFYIK